MIVHIILFRARRDLPEASRQDLLQGIGRAAAEIPSIRRFRVGRRVTHGLPGYEQMMRDAYDYAAIVELDDRDGLVAYLAHPAHQRIGEHFTASAEASLAYDYEMVEAADASDLLSD